MIVKVHQAQGLFAGMNGRPTMDLVIETGGHLTMTVIDRVGVGMRQRRNRSQNMGDLMVTTCLESILSI